jgi:PAS domain S-box-containing protein
MESHESPSTEPKRRHQGQPLLEPVAWVVVIVGVLGSVFGFFVTRDRIIERERQQLNTTALLLQDELDQTLTNVSTAFSEVSGAVIATDANPRTVASLTRTIVADNPLVSGVAVVLADVESGLSTYAEGGTVRALDLDLDPDNLDDLEAQATANESLRGLVDALAGLEQGDLAIVATESVEDFRIVTMAAEVDTSPEDLIVIIELSLPELLFDDIVEQENVNFAFYLGMEEDDPNAILASTDRVPLGGTRALLPVGAGEQQGLLVVAETGPLVSTAESALSWLILIGGLLLTTVLTPVTDSLMRRRRQVLTLSAENAALDEALAISRRIEQELRASEQRFRSVLTSSPDVILWMDPEGTHVQVLNRPDFFGHESATIERAEHFTSLIHAEDWPDADAGFKVLRWSEPGTITEFEFRLRDDAGNWRWVQARGGVAQLNDGETPYILAVLTEVTEQKREEMRRAELETQLVQSQRLEAVGQLAGGVAHDFNNILAAILSGAELVLDEVDGSEARDDIEEIQRTARRGAELSRQLLLFSRGEAGSSPEVLDLNEVVADIERMLERSIGETVTLKSELDDELKLILADRNEIERIIMNLAINARDAMSTGGELKIRTENLVVDDDYAGVRVDLEEGDYVELDVIDTGDGMPAEVIRRAFEPFFSTKDVGKGTGLGLATVYGIVQRSRGHIEIDSDEGKGTTIRVLLPITRVRDTPDTARKRDRAPRGSGERVLVVEDDATVRDTTARLLERRGYAVDVAEDGEGAAALAATVRFDLLLSDVLLPGGMSGKDVADVLLRGQPHLSVLFMTGHSADVLESVGLRPGDPRIIRKPFSETQLLELVRSAIDDVLEPVK